VNGSTLLDLETVRQRIVSQMTDIDRELSRMRRNDPLRYGIISQKGLLLRQLREQNLRIAEMKRKGSESSAAPQKYEVSDHALVRWLERKHGIDMDRLRSLLLSQEVKSALASEQKYWSDGRVVYVMKDGVVVTVISVAELPERTP
jgi:hypothetical protein